MASKDQTIEAIISLFKLDGNNPMIYGMLSDMLDGVKPEDYPALLQELHSEEF
ncbi:MAG: hypothetical protein R3203_10220 [Pseudoalteromonas tetraodonis]|nr:hypothetical protein [Pseudoalteromonas tetraodonis]